MVRKIFNIITTVILVVLIAAVIFIFYSRLTNGTPTIFGYQIYRVSSGSMEPVLKIGDVILDKQVQPNEIKKGDIITYKGDSGDYAGKIITHKVVEQPYQNEFGKWIYQTQGIATGTTPDPLVSEDQIQAKYVMTIPFINNLYNFFLSDYGLIAFVGLIVVLFAYEIISLIFSYRSVKDDMDEEYQEYKYKNDNDDNDDNDMYKPL